MARLGARLDVCELGVVRAEVAAEDDRLGAAGEGGALVVPAGGGCGARGRRALPLDHAAVGVVTLR